MNNEGCDFREIGIIGAHLAPLKIIETEGGDVLRMLRKGCPLMPDFPADIGEIYFSEVKPGAVKAWKQYKRQNQLFAVPVGQIRLALYDARANSRTLGVLCDLALGRPGNYNLLRIPAGVWYGFKGLGEYPALVCNCPDIEHDPADALRLDKDDPQIPFKW